MRKLERREEEEERKLVHCCLANYENVRQNSSMLLGVCSVCCKFWAGPERKPVG
uniref:Uncharacterized protein n=1 Tax=Arundo donax TaxID=35708 RepID=A0A0A9D6D3_ARUDO